ncbi:GvpL/GvpF family gas vesicle protein [Streptomyces sp. WAC05374]|uniref:GvpL/GvpF family gas vesicle protein n=1 Tax=Streptomyces sp. WAC05374 TaxID=2487420 RepID=UPI000F86578B|nr:GvpL/GvpF family gas vesicle protein [Streptomyces sp. WAC05374]RST15848.1 GvpL/GvpF family gas vesicle protein [Streptomyces sp. WAC05374]TDF46084.1 GvpL/GvpF family gas vesicle protein [Streptomyces sp. WAC05374]TDF53075.1 GvpL/GvpF family gas vesicle protein [Streptomyces sp. WAC05374]TDF58291.1 GvpL/GvpF family gas vesicle protein [Streptomyces sp. WAC05374]
MAVYVYAITPATHPLRLDGITGVGEPAEELRVVTEGDLAAVVSDAPDGLRAKRRDVIAHQTVLQELLGQAGVLPLRFGALAPDDDAVRDALKERADNYRDRLAALHGCTEFHLKASCDEDVLLRDVLRQSDEARRMNEEIRSGQGGQDLKVSLGELVAAGVDARRESLAAGVVEALRPMAREIREADASGDDFVSVSFLVERERQNAFLEREADLAEQFGDEFSFRLHGPLPPYSFV